MQANKFRERHEQWIADGRPRCDHLRRDSEYMLGMQTGDVGCIDCGEVWPGNEQPPRVDPTAEAAPD
jgi:hypothetical protein